MIVPSVPESKSRASLLSYGIYFSQLMVLVLALFFAATNVLQLSIWI